MVLAPLGLTGILLRAHQQWRTHSMTIFTRTGIDSDSVEDIELKSAKRNRQRRRTKSGQSTES
jgi:hypothetical protein